MNNIFQLVFVLVVTASHTHGDSPAGDVVGKLYAGYQGWFNAKGDNSPLNSWVHWGSPPSKGHQSVEIWPDVREYSHLYDTQYGHLGNGQAAKLFSSWDDSTVDVHFKWMQENNIDGAALQRFASHLWRDKNAKPLLNGMAKKVMDSAEKHSRKFYIMYDMSGWTNYSTQLLEDVSDNIVKELNLFKSKAYAHQNGKPVLCIWGIGVREGDPNDAVKVIKALQSQGLYVIGGVPTGWRNEVVGKKGFYQAYEVMNMISPWTVGRYHTKDQAASYKTSLKDDFETAKSLKIDYQPVLFPGFSWSNWKKGSENKKNEIPRLHGDFLWQQFVNIRELGIKNAYIAMFDEYDEGTAIAKAAEDKSMIPTDQYFLTLDADGVHVSSDFYLRLVGDGNRMMKGEIPLQNSHPTKHVL